MFELSQFPLKFGREDLAPFMSAQTVDFHYGKHLDTYIKNLNNFIADTEFAGRDLEFIIKNSNGKIFNNAAQVFNHNFFFNGLKRDSGTKIPKKITDAFADFKKEFIDAAVGQFGSGWAWLVADPSADAAAAGAGALKIMATSNADTPIAHGLRPILTVDVWEHAYYLDYQNRRADFVTAYLDHLVDWDWVAQNL